MRKTLEQRYKSKDKRVKKPFEGDMSKVKGGCSPNGCLYSLLFTLLSLLFIRVPFPPQYTAP